MEKVNFTSSKIFGWAKNSGKLALATCLLLFGITMSVFAQSPNCTNVNAGINPNDTSIVTIMELVTNIGMDSADVEITGAYGQRIFYQEDMLGTDSIVLNACRYLGDHLKVNVRLANRTSTCWSYLTFKQGNGPTIMGRSKTVYCIDPLVKPGMHIHGTPPLASVPCDDDVLATYVADWPLAFDCDANDNGTIFNDTAKIIYREYEAYDKYGVRGSGMDTIVVLRLPEIMDSINTWCRQKDTLYCGHGSKLGPYMVLQQDPDPHAGTTPMSEFLDCDPLFFVESYYDETARELIFKPAYFDPKCGIAVHVDAWKFDSDDCSETYKVDVEIKQSCFGEAVPPQTCDAVDFEDSYHPRQWDPMRTGTANGYWNNNGYPIYLASGAINVDGLKDQTGFISLQLNSGADEYIKECAIIPQDGFINFTYSGQSGSYYWINGWKFSLAGNSSIVNLPVKAGDELCFYTENGSNLNISNFSYVENPPMTNLDSIAPGYYRCTFWVVNLDTLPPTIECEFPKENQNEHLVHGDTLYVPATTHDCAAYTYIPPARVHDDWAGVKLVKARIEGITTVVLEQSSTDHYLWESHKQVRIPHGLRVPVIYEAFDSCHNLALDTCWLYVKDLTKPVPVCDKGVTVSLSAKKVWVEAKTFDEGSWDNCAINFLLARRSDWYTPEACVDICDSIIPYCWNEHYDTIFMPYLETDKHIDPVEAHYAEFTKWLKEDGKECSDLLWDAWKYDLMKHATLKCIDHPYEVDEHYFKKLLLELYYDNEVQAMEFFLNKKNHGYKPKYEGGGLCIFFEGFNPNYMDFEEYIDELDQLGGGWTEHVPFSCEDNCKAVTVELLVVDYWCNWAKCWTEVWVEDKTPVKVVKDVYDQEIACGAYKEKKYYMEGYPHKVSISEIVDMAKEGDLTAQTRLDEFFGGYEKVWVDEYGNYPEEKKGLYWNTHCKDTFYYEYEKVEVHDGYDWVKVKKDSFIVYHDSVETWYGQVAVNCEAWCVQDIWCDFDHCGQGYIYRKWKFIPGCHNYTEGWAEKVNHYQDTITRIQKIYVGNNCRINKAMFDVPEETTVYTCGIEYDEQGNATGALAPENTGEVIYKYDDDCRLVGIGYEDQVFKVVGGDYGCYKIIRKWHMIDWCEYGGELYGDAQFWKKEKFDNDRIWCEQKIIVVDTTAPVCKFAEELDTVDAAGCYYTIDQTVIIEEECGAKSYYWELTDDYHVIVASGGGELDYSDSTFQVQSDSTLSAGHYALKVRITDKCNNESYCIDEFWVRAGKKPAAICITSLTAELTPWDSDNDGIADSAHAIVWAQEFNSSSAPACGKYTGLEFRIECIDNAQKADTPDSTYVGDTTYLVVTCEDVGTKMVRMWVIDTASGTADYCDVMLIVQNNMQGCDGDASSAGTPVTGLIQTELESKIQQVDVTAYLDNGQKLNYITSASGAYSFAAALGQQVRIVPVKNLDADNGLSTLDLVMVQKYILGKEDIPTDYRKIAADANNDGKISAIDLVQIRKLILGQIDEFPENSSWRFFNNTDMQEEYIIDPIQDPMVINWTGVKIGDVNLSNDPARSSGRSARSVVFAVNDRLLTAGNEYQIDVTAEEFNQLLGYQMTMEFDQSAVRIIGLEGKSLEMSAENFSLRRADDGVLTTSWNDVEAVAINSGEAMFSVILQAVRDVNLSEVMTINSSVTTAEAYKADGSVSNVSLKFNNAVEQGFVLYQNRPNPFSEYTTIGFNLPNASDAQLTVFDTRGRVVYKLNQTFSKGYNEVNVASSDFKATGVLYYQLESENFTGMKKMIRVQ